MLSRSSVMQGQFSTCEALGSIPKTHHTCTNFYSRKITDTCNYNLKIFLPSMVILHKELIAKYLIADWALREFPRIMLQYFSNQWKHAFIIPFGGIF